jgi:GDP-mannose 4,6 dehydratase
VPGAFDDLSRGHAEFVRWGPLVQGDILDPAALAAAFTQHRPAAVIHFAALAYVGESVEQPLAYYRINIAGLINVLDAMARFGARTIVFSSSCATYGIPVTLPITESAPQNPISKNSPASRSSPMLRQRAGFPQPACVISMPPEPIPRESWWSVTTRKPTSFRSPSMQPAGKARRCLSWAPTVPLRTAPASAISSTSATLRAPTWQHCGRCDRGSARSRSISAVDAPLPCVA